MPIYTYKGRNVLGKLKTGKIEADNPEIARNLLLSRGIVRIEALEEYKPLLNISFNFDTSSWEKVKLKDLVIFTRQLYSMVNAGIPLVTALRILAQQIQNKKLKQIAEDLGKQVEEGSRFSTALAKYRNVFGNLYINMIRAAEEAGNLEETLRRLAEHLEKVEKLRSKVKSAMFYPTFVLIIATLITAGILIFIVPTFAKLYSDMGGQLPKLTRMVMAASDFLKHYFGWIFIFFVVFFIVFKQLLKINKFRYYFDKFLLTLPLFGPLIQKSAVANFSRTLASMISSGINILQALDIASQTSGNMIIEEEIRKIRSQVERGISLGVSLARSPIFPPMLVNMVKVGEEAGNLDHMLQKVAEFYEEEVNVMVDGLTSLIEPLMMVFIGGVIGVIIVALYLPIFNLGSLVVKH